MSQVIYFDLDGTLWDTDPSQPLIKPAWERLPYACRQILGNLPEDFKWSEHKGSTDLGVVDSIVHFFYPNLVRFDRRKIVGRIIQEMDNYYREHSPQSIEPLLFPDTRDGLTTLVNSGFRLGIVTGNSVAVTDMKLEQARLTHFFPERDIVFTGETAYTRRALLESAWQKNLFLNKDEYGINPLIYVADTIKDLTEMEDADTELSEKGAILEMRILLRKPSRGFNAFPLPNEIGPGVNNFRLSYFNRLTDNSFMEEVTHEWRFPDTYPVPRN